MLLTVACVSANDNMTDDIGLDEDSSHIISADDNSSDGMLEEDSNDDVEVESNKSATNISAEDIETFTDLKDEFTVNLTSNGSALANKSVEIILDGITYNAVTDDDGLAIISFKLKAGTYEVQFFFYGDDNYTQSNGTATIIVKPEIITYQARDPAGQCRQILSQIRPPISLQFWLVRPCAPPRGIRSTLLYPSARVCFTAASTASASSRRPKL